VEEIIRQLAATPDCREVFTSYKPDNHVADRLYRGLGFKDTGRVEDGELVVRLSLAKQT
jgi:diamine N-acetyltransferase